MLIFLLLFCMLRSLQGAPTTPSSFASAGDTLSLIARGDLPTSDGDGQNIRTPFSIVQSCLLTIFACVWKAMHPNIDAETDSRWTRLKRKITTTLVALIAPELILRWALEQRISARKIMNEYNEELAPSGGEGDPKNMWTRAQGYFTRLPDSVMHRGNGQRWTMSHGFFIQMGGFLLCDKGYPTEVLDYNRLAELLRKRAIDQPTVTERELQDRSKGDAISKGIVVWQTTWFALQCCARLVRHLPLSELEVVTLAFTVVNVAIYAAWWDKPQGVDTAVRLQLKEMGVGNNSPEPVPTLTESDAENSSDDEPHSVQLAHSDSSDCVNPNPDLSDIRPPMPEDEPDLDEKENWLWRKLRKDCHNHGLPIFLIFRLPYRIAGSALHYTLWKIGKADGFDGKHLRVPMFYAARNSSNTAGYSLAVIGLIFGAIHFLAWQSEFPSHPDQVLWRCAAIALVGFPSFTFLLVIIEIFIACVRSKAVKKALNVLKGLIGYGLFLPSIILYIPARLVVLILALKAIRNPSPGILQDVSWTSFIPHL